ncbi:CD209 antigen-like protein E [Cyprinodon tularosa]|uniref:CD209 antigen-like protein E n=1 Tax=Cyprinodon tularosa TaxID=77115 RepID=UPI0018E256B3|nr:CD209 antigen-like protein E [Cyprinodon tularosa]
MRRGPMMRRPQSCEEGEAASSQHENPTRTSKLPSERVVLLVLGSLLAAALIVICRLSTYIIQTKETLQSLTEENEVMRGNLPVFEEEPSCEKDWVRFEETCYYFSTNKFSWEESRNRCREAGAELVKVETREEQYFLRNNLNRKMKSFDDMFWIGLTDSEEEGRWVWVDGSELSERSDLFLMFWNALQPDNWAKENPAGEDCVRVGMEGGGGGPMKNWYDKDCSAAQKRICEKLRDTTTE